MNFQPSDEVLKKISTMAAGHRDWVTRYGSDEDVRRLSLTDFELLVDVAVEITAGDWDFDDAQMYEMIEAAINFEDFTDKIMEVHNAITHIRSHLHMQDTRSFAGFFSCWG